MTNQVSRLGDAAEVRARGAEANIMSLFLSRPLVFRVSLIPRENPTQGCVNVCASRSVRHDNPTITAVSHLALWQENQCNGSKREVSRRPQSQYAVSNALPDLQPFSGLRCQKRH
jgi:hypothetical protein